MLTLRAIPSDGKTIYTYFHNGHIVELPTRWLRFLSQEPRFSRLTIRQYASALKDLLAWFLDSGRYGHVSLDNILKVASRQDLQQWLQERKAAGLSASTLRHREVTIKSLFDWLTSADGGHIRTLANTPYRSGNLISASPAKRKPRYMAVEELITLLNGYYNESERVLVHALYDTGLRISESIRLCKRDLPDTDRFPDGLKYYPVYIPGSKGRGGQINERIGIISAPLLARIQRYHTSADYRFSPYFDDTDPQKPAFLSVNGCRLYDRNVRHQMKRAAARVGLNPDLFSPHKFRHGAAFAILQSELGRDYFDKLFLVQQLFGHRQIKTTEIYTAIPPAVLAKLNRERTVTDKYAEAKRIYEATWLPPRKHMEKRGHRR